MSQKPSQKPANPNFSSGPTTKRPGWNLAQLQGAVLGRSHRAKIGKNKLKEVIELTKEVLKLPEGYQVAIVPASDTGAVEMAMWSLLGPRGVDVVAWESFGKDWVTDAVKQLKIDDLRIFEADYGQLPDLDIIDTDRDVVFTWNGTTSGVKVPNADWIKDNRMGLTICDATSAVFAMDMPWEKLDVVTYSWQKVLGGEAAHGMLILSPRAIERLERYTPSWPLPKLFRLTKKGQFNASIFEGATINTPSMLCVEDALDGLKWVQSLGGVDALIQRSKNNLTAIENWVEKSNWIGFLPEVTEQRSNTGVCLKIVDDWYQSLPKAEQAAHAKAIVSMLDKEAVAYDIGAYRDAPAGLRIWCGGTVETSDVELLLPWLDWAFAEIKATAQTANAA